MKNLFLCDIKMRRPRTQSLTASCLLSTGAPLAMPLPLVRITSASYIEPSDGEGSVDDQSPAVFRPRSSPHMSTLGRRLGKRGLQMTQSCGEKVPDVIVN